MEPNGAKEETMRRGLGIGVVLLLILAAIAIGVGAYNAGFSQGLEESGRAGEVVRVIDRGPVFFPFGLFLFPLFLLGIFALMRGAFWRRRWEGSGHHGPGGWSKGPAMFEDWHRRQHDQSGDKPGSSGETASV
jgi:hypothetical protein